MQTPRWFDPHLSEEHADHLRLAAQVCAGDRGFVTWMLSCAPPARWNTAPPSEPKKATLTQTKV